MFARSHAHVENEGGMGRPALVLRPCSLAAGRARAAGSEMNGNGGWSGRWPGVLAVLLPDVLTLVRLK